MSSDPEDSSTRAALVRTYGEALKAYRRGQWQEAVARFADIAERCEDPPSREMLRRCTIYRDNPPKAWYGVQVTTETQVPRIGPQPIGKHVY